MPDIEVNGGNVVDMIVQLRSAFKNAPYRKDICLTRGSLVAQDLDGSPQPFLRVWASKTFPAADLDNLIRRLVRLNIDVEDDLNKVYHPKGHYRIGEKLYTVADIEKMEPLK